MDIGVVIKKYRKEAGMMQEEIANRLGVTTPAVSKWENSNSNQAKEEQNEDARPELTTHIENVEQYDIIFLGYPNWWGDMPQPLYTFLEEYDFSGKTIIPFNSHGGSIAFLGLVSRVA